MMYEDTVGPVPLIGIEVEVLKWAKGTRKSKISELKDRGKMSPHFEDQHNYNCNCGPCTEVGGKIMIPVQWKAQYDASLSKDGCEFISSPFPVVEPIVNQVIEDISLMADGSVWDLKEPNMREDGKASVGLHVHVSQPRAVAQTVKDCAELFYPELIYLSTLNKSGYVRPLTFRYPSSIFVDRPHHETVAIARQRGQAHVDRQAHTEWRFWEAAYDDEIYCKAAFLITGALTQVLAREDIAQAIRGMGHLVRSPELKEPIFHAHEPDGTFVYLNKYFDIKRYKFLHMILNKYSTLSFYPHGLEVVNELFGRGSGIKKGEQC